MKYTIQVNQIILSQYKFLDIKDAGILDYLRAWCQADDKKVRQLSIKEEGIEYRYTWINFKYLIDEMPLLKIKSKASISERISKLEKTGFIKTFRAPDRNLYIRLTAKIKELEFKKEKEGVYPDKQGVRLNEQGVFVKTNSTNNISIKHNTNNTSYKEGKKSSSSYGNEDINLITKTFKEALGGSLDGTIKENRYFAYLLLQKFKKDYPDKNPVELVQFLIKAALQDNFHSRNATSFKYLYYNAKKIIQSIKGRLNKIAIIKTK